MCCIFLWDAFSKDTFLAARRKSSGASLLLEQCKVEKIRPEHTWPLLEVCVMVITQIKKCK